MTRMFLVTLFVGLMIIALIFSGCNTPTTPPDPNTIRIGVMNPLTGPVAIAGKRFVEVIDLAFREIDYKIAGKNVELIVEDSGALPNTSLDKARKLVDNDRVAILIGPLTTPEKLAVAPYVAKKEVPHITFSPENPKVFESGWTFAVGGSLVQMPSASGAYAYEGLGFKTIDIMTMDMDDGRSFAAAFKSAFEKRGGKIVQEQYSAMGNKDFAPYLTKLKDADAVAAWFHGEDAVRFLTQYNKFGINSEMPLIAIFHGSFFAPLILNAINPTVTDSMVGYITPSEYDSHLDTEINEKFKKNIKDTYGYIAEPIYAEGYTGALVAIEALKATNGDTTPEVLHAAILKTNIDTPLGHISFDQETHCAILDINIVEIEKSGDYYGLSSPVHIYKQVPVFGLD
jgi:branched-chain amino acid transport system substrate-binding protein